MKETEYPFSCSECGRDLNLDTVVLIGSAYVCEADARAIYHRTLSDEFLVRNRGYVRREILRNQQSIARMKQ